MAVSHSTFEIETPPRSNAAREPLPAPPSRSFYCLFGKRALDVLMTIAALILLSPLFLLIAALVKISSHGPVLHRENRVGRDARIFEFLKFRTTRVDEEQDGWAISVEEDEEVTRLGFVLRALNLDGMPQLWNVLRGDMSIVGPRPEIPSYVAAYTRAQLRVLTVMPGITDVASILGRSEELVLARAADRDDFYRRVVLPEKLLLNLEYLDRVSLPVDLRLIVQSARSMFRPRRVPQLRA